MILNTNFASKKDIIMKNTFLNKLKALDPDNFEYKVDKAFELETGIRGKRLQTIIKTEGKAASVQEANSLLKYYGVRQGRILEFYELFEKDGNEEITEDGNETKTENETENDSDSKTGNDIYDAF